MAKIGVSSDTRLLLGLPPKARYVPILDRNIQVIENKRILFILGSTEAQAANAKVSIERLGVKMLHDNCVD